MTATETNQHDRLSVSVTQRSVRKWSAWRSLSRQVMTKLMTMTNRCGAGGNALRSHQLKEQNKHNHDITLEKHTVIWRRWTATMMRPCRAGNGSGKSRHCTKIFNDHHGPARYEVFIFSFKLYFAFESCILLLPLAFTLTEPPHYTCQEERRSMHMAQAANAPLPPQGQ